MTRRETIRRRVCTAPDRYRANSNEVPHVERPSAAATRATAIQKVRIGEDGWNSRDPSRVGLAYPSSTQATPDRHSGVACHRRIPDTG
jgi:hypothetical protein